MRKLCGLFCWRLCCACWSKVQALTPTGWMHRPGFECGQLGARDTSDMRIKEKYWLVSDWRRHNLFYLTFYLWAKHKIGSRTTFYFASVGERASLAYFRSPLCTPDREVILSNCSDLCTIHHILSSGFLHLPISIMSLKSCFFSQLFRLIWFLSTRFYHIFIFSHGIKQVIGKYPVS